jgi:hypothetical protein
MSIITVNSVVFGESETNGYIYETTFILRTSTYKK